MMKKNLEGTRVRENVNTFFYIKEGCECKACADLAQTTRKFKTN